MKQIIISTENTCDLTPEMLAERGIPTIELTYYVDDVEYGRGNDAMSFGDFYNAMRKGAMTRTSQVNVDEFEEYFSGLLKEGKDILHIAFASVLSGTCENAMKAAENLNKTSKNKIYVVESISESV